MDAVPTPYLGIQTLKMQVADQLAAIERHKLAVIEMLDRQQKNANNIAAARRAIAEMEMSRPDTSIGKQRLKSQIAAQHNTIERQLLENLEGSERAEKALENVEACRRSAGKYGQDLADMEKTHGPLTNELFDTIMASLKEPTNG